MYAASGNESEDEIVFVQPDGAQRILRGRITAETADSVILSRRDGDHELMRSTIRKIVRRSPKAKGFVARAIDNARQREEDLRQKVFAAVAEAAAELRAAEDRGEDATELRKKL